MSKKDTFDIDPEHPLPSKIVTDIPVPMRVLRKTLPKDKREPFHHPFRKMQPGDYVEYKIISIEQRKNVLHALRTTQRLKAHSQFVFANGLSRLNKEDAEAGRPYLCIWRLEDKQPKSTQYKLRHVRN